MRAWTMKEKTRASVMLKTQDVFVVVAFEACVHRLGSEAADSDLGNRTRSVAGNPSSPDLVPLTWCANALIIECCCCGMKECTCSVSLFEF